MSVLLLSRRVPPFFTAELAGLLADRLDAVPAKLLATRRPAPIANVAIEIQSFLVISLLSAPGGPAPLRRPAARMRTASETQQVWSGSIQLATRTGGQIAPAGGRESGQLAGPLGPGIGEHGLQEGALPLSE